jgi:hypothetical protein
MSSLESKICVHCLINLPITKFTFNRTRQKLASWCKKCTNKLGQDKGYHKNWRILNIGKYLVKTAKSRAKKRNIAFDITEVDFIVPEYCPILGIKLGFSETGTKGGAINSYSLDRINPELGYIKGNIMVMSHLANSMKSSATPEQLIAFSNWIKVTYNE